MAHFAQLDDNNVVINVIVVNDSDTTDDNGVETESVGIAFCQNLLGKDTNWRKTSYNNNIRGNYAGVGYTYDATLDVFIAPKPYASWTLSTATATWVAPSACPNLSTHTWDEDNQTWTEI